jgi:shikimate kinase
VNIFLVGPMGSGKSTIGRQLARELKLDFFDTDREIEIRTGADINWIFDVEGEAGFRQRESDVIAELSKSRGIVMATGGGSIENPNNRIFISSRGTVVYLYATICKQEERTLRDKNRPLLTKNNRKKSINRLI